ncbi:MAG: dTDP-glucose 4,6-dehydratase, partial [Pseudomonadota bacterium]
AALWRVINVDCLTYAGNRDSLAGLDPERHILIEIDINQGAALAEVMARYQPSGIVHFAAESHVDRSIDDSSAFIRTNVTGTQVLLDVALDYWRASGRENFRFLHVSTDEVYGDLAADDPAFTEHHAYQPSSPYAASKAAADHLVRAWHRTFGLPVLITNCSNNYGPRQFPEKLIPLMLINALNGRPLPVYGDGQQRRDWLFVDDHCRALLAVLERGQIGRTYNIGGNAERDNLSVVQQLCDALDERSHTAPKLAQRRRELIEFVTDRPGHDRRYAINASRIEQELGWRPAVDFETGLAQTIDWYLNHPEWWQRIQDGSYRGQRLGTRDGQAA